MWIINSIFKENPAKMKKHSLLIIALLILSCTGHADVRMPYVFSDNMVLQRDMGLTVWGWADAGEEISLEFSGQKVKTAAAPDGTWSLKLKAMPANKEPQIMAIEGKNRLELKNILVGDVWLCSGQSNMDYGIGRSLSKEEIEKPENSLIRHFKVERDCSSAPKKELLQSGWKCVGPGTIKKYTAVGYYFAREVVTAIDVPVGILTSTRGATRINTWIAAEGYRKIGELKAISDEIELRKTAESGEEDKDIQKPSGLFNAMVNPLIPFGIKGVLWYQGESNAEDSDLYLQKMQALVSGWRDLWKQGEFPFYYVQLANCRAPNTENPAGGDGWARVREDQLKALTAISNSGMAVAIDIGEGKNIHPKNKLDVGRRLAAWALAKDYKKDLTFSGPIYRDFKIEGNRIRIFFDYAENGLIKGVKEGAEPVKMAEDGKLKWFAVTGEDKRWYWADAVIDGSTVLVSSDKVSSPLAVRYAFCANPEGSNLYNKEGLPASPFRTDKWRIR
jgi:sialate O-acetylesterase